MNTKTKKIIFRIRMFCGIFLIMFSGLLTLPIYVSLKHSMYLFAFEFIFLCVIELLAGHWMIKRAYDKKNETHETTT